MSHVAFAQLLLVPSARFAGGMEPALQLHTASGETSWELDWYLTGMRVPDCFGGLYRPDHVDTAKMSPRYYQQVFADAGVAPGDAIVVDDSERALDSAAEVGAQTVMCRLAPPTDHRHPHVRLLAELTRLLSTSTAAERSP